MRIEEIALWEAFQGVAQNGGFSSAARKLKVGVPQLSKRVGKLEELLGIRLFKRSTRVVKLTDEGKSLLPRVTGILEDLAALENSFAERKEISGTVKVTCVPFIAERFLIGVLKEFMDRHQAVHVELELSEKMVNLADSEFDMAIRIHGKPADSSLIYRKLAPNRMIMCASPGYLKNHPSIKKPEDLGGHDVLMLDMVGGCRFNGDGPRVADVARRPRISCRNGAFLTKLGIFGFGVLMRAQWDAREFIESGELIEILKDYPLDDYGGIYAVIPSRRFLAPRVRAFLDFVVEKSAEWE